MCFHQNRCAGECAGSSKIGFVGVSSIEAFRLLGDAKTKCRFIIYLPCSNANRLQSGQAGLLQGVFPVQIRGVLSVVPLPIFELSVAARACVMEPNKLVPTARLLKARQVVTGFLFFLGLTISRLLPFLIFLYRRHTAPCKWFFLGVQTRSEFFPHQYGCPGNKCQDQLNPFFEERAYGWTKHRPL